MRNEQTNFSSDELRSLNAGESVAKKNPPQRLYPFVDDRVIKVDARLTQNKNLAEEQRNQIVIPKKSRLARIKLREINLK